MRYLQTVILAFAFFALAGHATAADEASSNFYALRHLGPEAGGPAGLKPLSDERLGTIEGSSRMSRWNSHIGARQMEKLMLQYLVYRLLSDLFRGGGLTSQSGQGNFLIQVNLAVGNHIVQTNDGLQQNFSAVMHRIR
jgi:hypothetical protein